MPQKKPSPKIRLLLGGICLVLGLYLGVCYALAVSILKPPREAVDDSNRLFIRNRIPGPDGETVVWTRSGSQAQRPDSNSQPVTTIIAHGLGGNPSSYFPLAEELRRMGDVVVVAMRGQTVSPIDRIDFGAGESRDLAAVAKWVKKRNPKTRVILVGVSLGGAASLMAAGQNPELIDGVITEGAFARLDWAVDEYLSVSLPGGGVIFRPTIWIVQAMTGVRASDVVPMDSTKALANRPCLIVHGEEDRVFSRRHPEALTQNQNCRVWIAPLAGHSQVPRILLQEYVQKIEATVQESSLKRL